MAKFAVEKRYDNSNEGFTETVKYYVMHQANVESNHNKYYCIELQKHPDGRYRIFTHYGRLGISNIFEVRAKVDGKDCFDLGTAEDEVEAIHKKKLSGKSVTDPVTGKKEKECYVDIDVVSPQVGSENIRGKAEVKKQVTVKIAVDTTTYDPTVAKLVDQLIEENVHSITSMTSIKLTANGFATELGPVTSIHVDKARKVLDDLNDLMDKDGNMDSDIKDVKKLNSLFFSLIPKPFSRKISSEDMILDAKKIQDEYDLLDNLATGVQMGSAINQNTAAKMNALGTDIELLTDKKEIQRLEHFITSTKADNHRHDDVWKYKPVQYFQIRIPEERKRFELQGKQKGNIKECFHGSSGSNCLSILKGGLVIPPSSAPHVCGRMMGAGAYFALSSSKSARYSLGSWGGKKSKYGNIFLFIADLALGNYYETYSATPGGTPKGYDSIWAKAGKSLYNDELVTPNLCQQTLKYIVELRP
jgi:poly [ADP-ribose] polymerase 2/3/4